MSTPSTLLRFLILLFLTGITLPGFATGPCATSKNVIFPKASFFVLGETHGTNESPAVTLELICHLRSQYQRIFVGLEIPMEEAKVLGLAGSVPDQQLIADLQSSYFWSRDFQDGRSSQAMISLLKALNDMKKNVSLFAFASSEEQAEKGLTRVAAMTENTKTALYDYSKTDAVVILTGNYHAQKRNDNTNVSFAQELTKEFTVTSVKLSHEKGKAWNCYPGKEKSIVCGERQLQDNRIQKTEVSKTTPLFHSVQSGFDGEIVLKNVTASFPFKSSW